LPRSICLVRWAACAILTLVWCRCLAQETGGNFSELAAIRRNNVGQLVPAFSFAIDRPSGYAGAPAASGEVVYLVTPFPHTVYALDLARPASPIRWQVSLPGDMRALGLACCNATTSGAVLDGDSLYFNTLDGHTLSLDATAGTVRWNVAVADIDKGETLSRPPLVADGRVYLGNAGDDFGARGWVAALDAASGSVLWKRYSTGPDADVGIGQGFVPHDEHDEDHDLGVASWPPGGWQQSGGGLAGNLLYDPALGLLIHGTGHPAPWSAEARPGANDWTSGLFARDAVSGAARWFRPINPHDRYAFGAGGSLIAADMPWRGGGRRLLLHADANGRVYVLERASGELLSAGAFAEIDAKPVGLNSVTRDICPGWPGATGDGTGAAAFSPQTGLLYIPASRLCMDMEPRQTSYMPGTPFTGVNLRMKAPRRGSRGALIAWDIQADRPAWSIDETFPLAGGVLATAGGLVFYGTLDGWLKAADARTGQVLWRFQTGTEVASQPISFQRADGRQCIVVIAGIGGVAGQVAENSVDVRDATAAQGYANAIRDLLPPQRAGGMLYVFALP
jgi:PQQ-dependent dehydrogenase (methanol/ethanol family)